jgi:CheY-like chemotaxis protein
VIIDSHRSGHAIVAGAKMATSTIPFALSVDDDAIILMHISDILEDAGFRVLDAGDGDKALELLKTRGQDITLLFTDVEMPGLTNGFALARAVSSTWPDIEIVVCSGRITPAPGDLPDRATFISKPFSPQTVHNHLRDKLPDGKKPEPLKNAV